MPEREPLRQGSAAFPSADPRSARLSIRYIKYRVSPQEVLDLGAPCKAPKWCSHPESGLAPARCRFRPRQHHELADEDRFARTSHPLNRPEDTVGRTGRESRSRTAPHPGKPARSRGCADALEAKKNAAVGRGVVRGPRTRGPRVLQRARPSYGKRISTRRFCGSRTPAAVGTRGSFMPRPVTAISLRATPRAARAVATAFARRSESR